MKSTRVLYGLLGAALTLLFACGGAQSTKQFSFRYTEMRAKLDNGIRMVIIPDKTSQMVQVDIRYHVGSNQDPEGKAGLAHLLEHMMFQWSGESFWGQGQDGPALFNVLPQIAVGYNAYTNWDTTHYYLQGSASDVAKLLDLEARRMRSAVAAGKSDCKDSLPGVPRTEFFRELEVVRNEIRWRSGDTDGQIMQTVMDLAYPGGHPYHQMIGGNDVQLASIQPVDVCKFFKNYYTPERATIVVAGNVDHEEVAKLVKGYFGPIEKGTPGKIDPVPPIELKHQRIVKELDVESPQVNVIWRLPDMNSDQWPAAVTMINALAGRASMFVDEWKIARSVNVQLLGGKHAPIFVFTAHLFKEGDVDEALEFIWKAAKGAHRGTDEMEMPEETRNLAKASIVESLESLAARTALVADKVQFSSKTPFDSKKDYLLEEFKSIDELSDAHYEDFIKREMKKEKAIVLVVKRNPNVSGKDKRAESTFSGDPHKQREAPIDPAEATKPLSYPQQESALSKAERYELPNGMKVVLLPTSSMPLVHVQLQFAVGATHEPADKAGLASMAASSLRNIMTSMALGKIGVRVRGSAGMDETSFVGRGVELYLKEILTGLERTLVVGDYEQEGIEAWRERYEVQRKLKSFRAQEAFSMAMAGAVYGPEHPYTLKGGATTKTYKNIGRDALKSFADKHYVAKNATLIVVGSFDPANAKSLIKDVFGGFRAGKGDAPDRTPHAARDGATFIGVVKKEAPQTTIQIQYPGPVGVDMERYAARRVLGMMLNERMAKMRTILGSTYGAYAGIGTGLGARAYSMGGSFDSMRVGESLAAMRKEVEDLRRGSRFNIDFAKARRTLLKSLLTESGETYALASRLGFLAKYSLPPDGFDRLVEAVATLTPDKVFAVMTDDLKPENEVVGIFSDRATLEKAFSEAGIENPTIIEPE